MEAVPASHLDPQGQSAHTDCVHRELTDQVDSFETYDDRLAVKFQRQHGTWWVDIEASELVETLQRSLREGSRVECTYAVADGQIVDAIVRD